MILNRVKLNDFISHKHSEFELGYGISVVIGPNGAGKTSVLDAISFALFNDYSGRGKKENLINSKANKCKAAVEFTEGGIRYAAEWSMDRNKSARGSLYRLQNDSRLLLAQGGGSAVVPEVEKILGIDKSMFLQSIYVRQGEIEELVTSKPADRKTLISKLLGVEDLQKAWESIRFIIDEFEKVSDELKGELAQRSEIEAEKQKHLDASSESEKELQSKNSELLELDEKIKGLRTALDQLKESKKSFDKLDRQKGDVEKGIENDTKRLNEKREELDEAVKSEEKVRSLEGEVGKLSFLEDYAAALSRKREQESQQARLHEKLENLDRLEKTLRESEAGHQLYLDKESLLKEGAVKRKELESAGGALEKVIKQIQQLEKEERKKSSDLEKELTKWSKALGEDVSVESFEFVLDRKRKEFQGAAETLGEEVHGLRGRIGGLENKAKELSDSISKLGEAGVMAKTCPTCETELSADRVAQLLEKFTAEKAGNKAELQRTTSELGSVAESKKQADEKFRKADQLDAENLGGLNEELKEKRSKLEEHRAEVAELEKQADALKTLDNELKQLESEKAASEEAFREFESAKRESARVPSRDQIEAEVEPVVKALEDTSKYMKEAASGLGYEPEEPEAELKALRLKKQEYDQNVSMAKRRPELEENVKTIEQSLGENKGKLANTNEAIEKLAYGEEEHLQKQTEFDDENRNKSGLEKDITRLATEKKAAESEKENCEKKLKALKKKESEKKAVDGFIGLLSKIRTAYGKDGVQKMIRARARPLLERSTRDLFERFNLAYSDISIDDDYNIAVMGSAGEQDIDQISGGERVALAIALRLAIAQVLSGRVETIIMDEPTTHLDEERRKELVNILSSFFREGGRIIPQMLIITHHREIEDVADIIYTVKKEEGYSIAKLGSFSEA
jgi:exonuclease SbcC